MCDSAVCNQSLCDQLPPECKYGEKLVSYYRSDSCCPQHVCGEFSLDWLKLKINHHWINNLSPRRSAAWLLLLCNWISKPLTFVWFVPSDFGSECDPDLCEPSIIPTCRDDQTLIATKADGSCCLAHICSQFILCRFVTHLPSANQHQATACH